MKTLFKTLGLIAVSIFFLHSCTDDETATPVETPAGDNLKLAFEMTINGEPFNLSTNGAATTAPFQGIRVDRMMVYFSDIEIQNQNDEWLPVSEVLFYNLAANKSRAYDFTLPEGDYKAMRFAVGLNASQNGSDPLTHELDDPLSTSNGMYWSWATKYRFVIMEGRFNLNGPIQGTTSDLPFTYHPGHDNFYEVKTYSKIVELKRNELSTINISVALEGLIDGAGGLIELPAQNTTHTTPEDYPIAEMFMANFRNAITLK